MQRFVGDTSQTVNKTLPALEKKCSQALYQAKANAISATLAI